MMWFVQRVKMTGSRLGSVMIVAFGIVMFAPGVLAATPGADDPAAATGCPSDDLGKQTRSLLSLQVSGRAAAPGAPILGDEASASYKRYMDSFSKPIPDFFTNTIKSNSGS